MDRRNLAEIFKLEARAYENERVDLQGLLNIFHTVGFDPNQKQINVFGEILKEKGGTIGCAQFLSVFDLKRGKGFIVLGIALYTNDHSL